MLQPRTGVFNPFVGAVLKSADIWGSYPIISSGRTFFATGTSAIKGDLMATDLKPGGYHLVEVTGAGVDIINASAALATEVVVMPMGKLKPRVFSW